jgi:Bacterial protein of unknown function (DUF839)
MRKLRFVFALAGIVSVTAVIAVATAATGGTSQTGFKTAKGPYLVPTASGVQVDPIISAGDTGGALGSYQMSGIPDGLGDYRGDARGRAVVVMNHELGRSFPNTPPGVDTRITRLEIDRSNHSVFTAEYLFEGNEGFERFCSATLITLDGDPFYFTGEEAVPMLPAQPPGPAHDGSSIVMDPDTGMWVETEHFGHFQHENVVPLRMRSKWVFLSSEDDFRPGPSYLYAYISDTFNGGIRGVEGSLYVWKANNAAKNQNTAVAKNESIPGTFVPLTQAQNSDSTALKAAATAADAFEFDRLEDIAVRPDVRGRTYIADTGKPPNTARGRIYQFDVNPNNPLQATLKMILNADAATNPDDMYNPDNMDASSRVLMIQEDRESAFRGGPVPPNPPVADAGFSRVLEYNFRTGVLRSVARVNTPAPIRPGNWESSGIIDASNTLGSGWWLLDVQAHGAFAPQPGPTLAPGSSTGEDGQLLAMFVPGSTGGGGDDDDDDEDDDDDD